MKTTNRPRIGLYVRRSFAEKLSATFDFTSENVRPLLRYLSAFLLPLCVGGGVFYSSLLGQMSYSINANENDLSVSFLMLADYALTTIVSVVAYAVIGGVIYTLMQQYWARPSRLAGITYAEMKAPLWANLRRALSLQMVLLLAAIIVVVLIIGIGAALGASVSSWLDPNGIAAIAGGGMLLAYMALVIVLVPLSLVVPARILGGMGIWASVKQSMRLGFRVWGGLLGMIMVLYMICQLIGMALGIPFWVLSLIKIVAGAESTSDSLHFATTPWFTLVTYLSGVLFLYGTYMGISLLQIGLGFYYGHAAEKIDGTSMEQAVDSFETLTDGDDQATAPAPDSIDDEITHFDQL